MVKGELRLTVIHANGQSQEMNPASPSVSYPAVNLLWYRQPPQLL